MTIEDFNKFLNEVLGMEPLTEFDDPKGELDHEMKEGLAQAYAIRGFRKYLERAVNTSIKYAALAPGDENMRAVFRGRALSLKELLIKGRRAFEQYERISKLRNVSQEKASQV